MKQPKVANSMNPLTEFKNRLKEKRNALGISQKDLASKIGVSGTTIQKYESGASWPKGPHLVSLSRVLNCSIDWLMTGINPIKNSQLRILNSSPFDSKLLENVIEGVENGLKEMEITLPPKVKGKTVSLLYKYFSEANKAVDSSVIKDYLKLAS